MFGFLTGFFKKKEAVNETANEIMFNRLQKLGIKINKLILRQYTSANVSACFVTDLGKRTVHFKQSFPYKLVFRYASKEKTIIYIAMECCGKDEIKVYCASALNYTEIDLAILEIEEIVKKDLENRSKQYV